MTTVSKIDQWTAEARKQGEDAAKTAATWACDGNTMESQRRTLLAMLEDGDPEAWDFLPPWPNLSGEWADDPTPLSLARGITGEDDPSDDAIDAIAEAFEDGVSEVFEDACVTELKAGLSDE